jgi:signal transduction histidine kinase
MGNILAISVVLGTLITILVIMVLEISIDKDMNKLSKLELEYLKAKDIIRNKDKYSKIEIQKAQQKIDEYNSDRLWK